MRKLLLLLSFGTLLSCSAAPGVGQTDNSDVGSQLVSILKNDNGAFDSNILLYKTPSNKWQSSTVYKWNDFLKALNVVLETGIDGNELFLGGDVRVGLISLAAFLGQSMQETIQYDACDENNWSNTLTSPYPASAACGQAGQDYGQYLCGAEDKNKECPPDPNMVMFATTHAEWYGAPPAMFCAPKSMTGATGHWETSGPWCSPDMKIRDPLSTASVNGAVPEWIAENIVKETPCVGYPNQSAGGFTQCGTDGCPNWDGAMSNSSWQVRTDVEGCCWWGRGVIQTTGRCNIGKLNYALAGREYKNNQSVQSNPSAPYKDLDLCKNPSAICDPNSPKELKWIAGFFYWLESVQAYAGGDWNFQDSLTKNFADIYANPKGANASAFIDATSGIVNRGCPFANCGTGAVDGGANRKANFIKVVELMQTLYPPQGK